MLGVSQARKTRLPDGVLVGQSREGMTLVTLAILVLPWGKRGPRFGELRDAQRINEAGRVVNSHPP